MGYTTDFIGHIDIEPPLNGSEIAYLQTFSASRRWARPDGPYAVPGNPAAERDELSDATMPDGYSEAASGQPQLYCQWVPCWDGCCLAFDGAEKFYEPVRWMRYLIEHFLKPGARARASGLAYFEDFTFDHVLDGLVVGCRRDDKELFAIRVEDSVVTEEILRSADPRVGVREALAYEAYLDQRRESRPRRRPRRRSGDPGSGTG